MSSMDDTDETTPRTMANADRDRIEKEKKDAEEKVNETADQETFTSLNSAEKKWKLLRAGFGWCSRKRFPGSLLFNFLAFLLPALYETISKTWVAHVEPDQVVITDVYVYILAIASILNDGLPRAAWTTIGDNRTRNINSRISLSYTLIIFQMTFGLIMTGCLIVLADKLANTFVHVQDPHLKVTAVAYVRISSVVALSSALEVAVSNSTRALDRPEVPLIINTIKFLTTAILDAIIMSRARVGDNASIINHALVRMACDLISGACGLGYFIWIAGRQPRTRIEEHDIAQARPCLASLTILVKHGVWTFGESIIRNSLYLWMVHSIARVSPDYSTAWGVFNTIRGGLLMVPLQALEASTLTFVGHVWARWRHFIALQSPTEQNQEAYLTGGSSNPKANSEAKANAKSEAKPNANLKSIFHIANTAWTTCSISLIVEIFIYFLFFWAARDFAFYLSGSHPVAELVQRMWRTVDWCYIFYGISYQLAAVLIATTPRFFFLQGLAANLLWMLPWAAACSRISMTESNAWTYHGIAFGGSLVVDFVTVILTCMLWAWMLTRGSVSLMPVTEDVEDAKGKSMAKELKAEKKAEKKQEKKQEKKDKKVKVPKASKPVALTDEGFSSRVVPSSHPALSPDQNAPFKPEVNGDEDMSRDLVSSVESRRSWNGGMGDQDY